MKGKDSEKTSWGHVAAWYDALLQKEGTYQSEVILPNLLRLMSIKPGDKILDLACGPGFFSQHFAQKGAKVLGLDISPEFISMAREKFLNGPLADKLDFKVGSSDDLSFLPNGSMDKIAIIMALENIQNVPETFSQCYRVLSRSGSMHMVMNHPAFRIPGASSWEWDDEKKVLYRRIERYLSESSAKIKIHPGSNPREYTVTFHRPLQWYFKHLTNKGFCITRVEEWISHKKSQKGPRKEQEDRARKEIPLFLYIEARPFP